MQDSSVNYWQITRHNSAVLGILLADKSTGGHLRWATDIYATRGNGYLAHEEIDASIFSSDVDVIRSRSEKGSEEQQHRTRDKGEVFTPSWVCNLQNNQTDESWFGGVSPFNVSFAGGWKTTDGPIVFPAGKCWTDYIDNRVLEITCGEAPYLVSRYDATTGREIRLADRIGLLDRKFRVLNENASDDDEWLQWALRSIESAYGFDYQGDNVFLARENVFSTYLDNYVGRFGSIPSLPLMKVVANRVAWNIWQMDLYDCTAPFSSVAAPQDNLQLSLFAEYPAPNDPQNTVRIPCRTYNWRSGNSEQFKMYCGKKD